MKEEYVRSFLRKHRNYVYVKENDYSFTCQTNPDKNGKVKSLTVMESYFWNKKS